MNEKKKKKKGKENTSLMCVWKSEEKEKRKVKKDVCIFVGTRFVTNSNSAGFARKKAPTISFVKRGFERLGLGHQAVGFSWCSYMFKLPSPLESFSWRWAGRLWFLIIFPSPPSFGAPTFSLYSPSWLILSFHLSVRQVLAFVPVPSTVSSYFFV